MDVRVILSNFLEQRQVFQQSDTDFMILIVKFNYFAKKLHDKFKYFWHLYLLFLPDSWKDALIFMIFKRRK